MNYENSSILIDEKEGSIVTRISEEESMRIFLNSREQISLEKTDTVFDNAKAVDTAVSTRPFSRCQSLQDANTYITPMANNIMEKIEKSVHAFQWKG